MKIGFHTLGCKVNQYETEAIIEMFVKKGYEIVEFEAFADVYIINTCTVTSVADKKSRQMLSKARKNNADAIVVAMGCYAQIAQEQLQEIPEIDLIIGSTKKNEVLDMVERYLENKQKEVLVEDLKLQDIYEEMFLTNIPDKRRAHIKIQDGCNQFCAYCIIPYTRGRVRSRLPENVVKEVRAIVGSGFKEIVLTGIHLASYGIGLEDYQLIDLLQELNQIEGLERIRLGSLEPTLITAEFAGKIAGLNKVCPHFHLSLQSGCDETLRRMNRKYTTNAFKEAVSLLRRHFEKPSITTDIIVGFPGETEEEFEQTMQFVGQIQFSDIHIFKYSIRKGTQAATMKPQIADSIKSQRSKTLSALRTQMKHEYMESFLGTSVAVLFEEKIEIDQKWFYSGHSKRYLNVLVESKELNLENELREIYLENILHERIIGK